MKPEIEIKLRIPTREAAEALRRDPRLAALGSRTVELEAVYYDTPSLALSRRGIGLRMRRENGRYVATLKAGGRTRGGLHRRNEQNVLSPDGVLRVEDFGAGGARVRRARGREPLVPVVTTRITRETGETVYGSSRLELALDTGEVRSGDRRELLQELEVELLAGRRADLLRFQAELLGDHPLEPESRSKLSRGLALRETG